MKYEVMLKILTLLLQKRKITAGELADKYGVSTRSVHRYIDELSVCGVPVNIERGRYGGISIADTYRLPVGYFTHGEYTATINALEAMSSQIYDENIISAKEKLESTQKTERTENSVCGNILIDGGSWCDDRKFSEKMRVCEQAVNEHKSLIIDYVSREGEHSKRVIDAHVLIFKGNVWYLYAFCHTKQDFRTFKIGRIRSAAFTGKTFEKREIKRDEIDLDFGVSDEERIFVTLGIDKQSLADAEEWLGIDNIEPYGNIFTASLSLPDNNILINKILSFGGTVKVLDPPELRERIKKAALHIAENA